MRLCDTGDGLTSWTGGVPVRGVAGESVLGCGCGVAARADASDPVNAENAAESELLLGCESRRKSAVQSSAMSVMNGWSCRCVNDCVIGAKSGVALGALVSAAASSSCMSRTSFA